MMLTIVMLLTKSKIVPYCIHRRNHNIKNFSIPLPKGAIIPNSVNNRQVLENNMLMKIDEQQTIDADPHQ